MHEIYITADTHFSHKNILRHCNRPWRFIDEHDEALIENWNQTVSSGDTIYHLGDFAMISAKDLPIGVDRMKYYRRLRARLNGKIILIKGNHDAMSQELYNSFTEVHEGLLERKFDSEKVCMSHYPLLSWAACNYLRPSLYGHCHGRLKYQDDFIRIDVGVDCWDYKPISWNALKIEIDKQRQLRYASGRFNVGFKNEEDV